MVQDGFVLFEVKEVEFVGTSLRQRVRVKAEVSVQGAREAIPVHGA